MSGKPSYKELENKLRELEEKALCRRNADEVLRKSEERYRMIFNYSPLGIIHFDCDGGVVDCNERFLEIVGAQKDRVMGFNMINSILDNRMRVAIRSGLAGEPNYFEGDYLSATGNKLTPVRAMFSRVNANDGKFLGAVGLFEDISVQRQAEEALVESREFVGKILNCISDPIVVKDRQHRIVLVNDAVCALAGKSREELIGKTDYEFFPKDQVDIFWEKDEMVLETGEENENEEQITDAKGTLHTIATKKSLYTDKSGNKFIVGVLRDITYRKKGEEALRQSKEMYRQLFNTVSDAILVFNAGSGQIIDVNERATRLYGFSREEFLGLSYSEISAESDMFDSLLEGTLSGKPVHVPLCYHRKRDGRFFPVEISSSTFKLSDRQVLCGIVRDMTDRRRAEEELSAYRDHLEDLVRKRTAELAKTNQRLTLEIEERRRIEEALKLYKSG